MQVSDTKGCFKVINFTFRVLSFSFGFDPAAIEVYPAFFDLRSSKVLHQTMFYAASVRNDLNFILDFSIQKILNVEV
jgi:hypothetical protein